MDAKKKAKFIKPRYFNDTKAYTLYKYVCAGFFAYIAVSAVLGLKYISSHPDKLMFNNPLTRYVESENFRLRVGRILGIIPPDRELVKKYNIHIGNNQTFTMILIEVKNKIEKHLKMNSLDEDLDDSALICKSLIPKRKAFQNVNPKNSKQIKLDAYESSKKSLSQNEDKLNNDLTKDKVTSKTDSKWGESSSYFSEKHSTCPLCLKAFKSDSAYSTHMKQCAKSHKMTTQQLLEALELQKKQMRERRALGLGSLSLPSSKKPVSKKTVENSLESYDLALGLALSKSLANCESKTGSSQGATLEEFGFTSKNAVSSRKKGNDKKLVLKERTTEERQRIIVEKVAVVLLDDQEEANSDCKIKQNSSQNTQIPQLWNLGENNEKCDWYVTKIKPLVLLDEENTPEKIPPLPENISNKILELNLPRNEFNESWRKMINNNIKSDLIGRTKDNQDVYLHSLVLLTRCPEILEIDFESTFLKFNLTTILIFLEYLYCGTLNSLIASEIDDLFNLASEVNFKELVLVLDCLKSKLKEVSEVQTAQGLTNKENKAQETVVENGKLDVLENKNVVSEDNSVDFMDEGDSNESNAEKSYWSFIQHEKRKQNSIEKDISEKKDLEPTECKINSKLMTESEETKSIGDLVEDAKTSSDCIVLSSGSEPQQGPSTPFMDYDVPHYDPYDNFIAEEPLSPVGSNSQSLLMGDISVGSLKLSSPVPENEREINVGEQKKTVGYCSTPVTAHHSKKIKSSSKGKCRRRSDLSSNRILRKSLGLKNKTPKRSIKKKGNSHEIVEALANSVLHELSKSPLFQRKNFVEITPLPNREGFRECVTPSPNFSIMGETLIKEQLTKYGLKKNLAKSKAKKILRHIFEELHPLYNTETGKIVKMLPSNTPKTGKSKSKKTATKTKKGKAPEKIKNLNSSSELLNMSDETICSKKSNSDGSEFEDLNETLTQSLPSNPIDLPSAFCEFLKENPDYHQQILLYEPIWLEELQKSLKETFKKHFKMSDLIDYLDQNCITFRSVAQAKKLQKKNQEKKTTKKRSPS